MRWLSSLGLSLCGVTFLLPAAWAQEGVVPPAAVQVAADGIPQPLTRQAGDAARGRAIVTDRSVGLCLLCHSGPFPEQRFQGNLAPSLAGAGARLSPAQLRLRMVDSSRLNAETIMPSYYRVDGLNRVAAQWQGKTLLNAQQIEDVIAFLASMRQ
jgi:sulfur-oxidizing protein SoxX